MRRIRSWRRATANEEQHHRLSARSQSPPAPSSYRTVTTATRRLPISSLRVFVAVAPHSSLRRPADALGATARREPAHPRTRGIATRRRAFRPGPLSQTVAASGRGRPDVATL
jgi:hypothetical protein